ncbi:hypothetical protein ACVW1C_002327 [Bradyrhizobium sp. USDA 4011]
MSNLASSKSCLPTGRVDDFVSAFVAKNPDLSAALIRGADSHAKNNRRQKLRSSPLETQNQAFQKSVTAAAILEFGWRGILR